MRFIHLLVLVSVFRLTAALNGERGDTGASGIPSVEHAKNPACVPWYGIRDAIMGGIFQGRCNDLSRAAIRLSFHDAAPFSLALQAAGQPNGAADGSIIFHPDEVQRPANDGLQTIAGILQPLPEQFNVSAGDIVAVAGALGVLSCPGGPVIRTYVGRSGPPPVNPDGLLPDTNSPVEVLLARFADMGFAPRELMALIGSHTTGRQRFVDVAEAGEPFDSTIDVWDVRFYTETQNNFTDSAAPTFHLPSDRAFSHHPLTQPDYNRFVGFKRQDNWAQEYADAHAKMSLVGQSKAALTECTEILPAEIDLENLIVAGDNSADPAVDPVKLEAAIQSQRSIWLV
ncbi:heme peroxidase [Hymenopellis radicata]|nr:heme peroxidase [Hymenopellis radicata]